MDRKLKIIHINSVYLHAKCRQMLKSIILFFRSRKIKKNQQQRMLLQFPDLQKYPTMTLLVDNANKDVVKGMKTVVEDLFKPKSVRFVILTEMMQDDCSQDDMILCVEKNDFNMFGILKKEKEMTLRLMHDEVFVNLSDNNENLLNDYLVSCIDSKFKIGHSKTNMKLHDLVIDYGIEKKDTECLKILYKYLMMLSGNKNEE